MYMVSNLATGEMIRELREKRGVSRIELAEAVGISESHMDKIEAGSRKPSINTYEKIVTVLGAKLVVESTNLTVQDRCVKKVSDILGSSTEKQACFLVKVIEHMAEDLKIMN